jgi:hypothetical protein
MAFIYDLTDTWNAGGTAFNAIKMNVTDTASAAASRLLTLQVGGAERFSVRKDGQGYFAGNVGIGTTAPGFILDVQGSTSATSRINVLRTGGAGVGVQILSTGSDGGIAATNSGPLNLYTSNLERMRVTAAGLVGIGTTAPRSILSAATATGSVLTLESTDTTLIANDVVGEIDFYANDGSTNGTGVKASVRAFSNDATGNNIALAFATSDGTTLAADRMILDGQGRLGIGTTTPAQRLHLRQDQSGTSAALIQNRNASGSPVAALQFITGPFDLSDNRFAMISSAGGSNATLQFWTSQGATPTEKMRVTDAGELGIGTTTPAGRLHTQLANTFSWGGGWNSGVAAFGGGTSTAGALAISYNDTDGAVIGAITPGTAWRNVSLFSDNLIFATNGSTERMRITSAGLVGIGTSSPSNKLTVRDDTAPTFFDTTLDNTTMLACVRGAGLNNFGASLGFSRLDSAGRVNAAIAIKQTSADSDQCGLSFFTHSSASTGASLLEAMSITHAGNVGIGTATPDGLLTLASTIPLLYWNETDQAVDEKKWRFGVQGKVLSLQTTNDAVSAAANAYQIVRGTGTAVDTQIFSTGGAERLRIDSSGNLLVATTSASTGNTGDGFVVNSSGDLISRRISGAGRTHVTFVNGGVTVGSITTNGTTTTYNITSDRRLKHDIVDAPEASSLIDAMQVRSFKWNIDDSEQRYGFVAQELVEVAPEAVSAPADEDEMMGVDYSKLVPMLVKEIQSLRARVAQLEGN